MPYQYVTTLRTGEDFGFRYHNGKNRLAVLHLVKQNWPMHRRISPSSIVRLVVFLAVRLSFNIISSYYFVIALSETRFGQPVRHEASVVWGSRILR
jgi:hypothetical protein